MPLASIPIGDDLRVIDWGQRADELEREGELGLPWIESAVAWVASHVPTTATVIDLGCGPGVATCVLAGALPNARVIAVDESAALLDRAQQRASRFGLGGRVRTQRTDVIDDVAALPSTDLIWASRVLHHVPDPQRALGQLRLRLRPNAVLALVEGGLPSRFLPDECGVGEPGLLSRLDAEPPHVHAARMGHRSAPVRTSLDWPFLLQRAGLRHLGTRSFLLDLPAPVSDQVRYHVVLRLQHSREHLADTLNAADRAALDRLLDPVEELGVLRRPDLFYLSAYTVHLGRLEAEVGKALLQ
jgi:SAM-dependent methyltransferase